MPTSTAATVMRASSPGDRPATLTGSVRLPRGLILSGALSSTESVRASRSISNHAVPSDRPGMRRAA
jgi:hypothetical protein